MYGFEDMKRDFEDGRLKEFVVGNNCQDNYRYAFDHQGETLPIVDIRMNGGEYKVYFKKNVAITIEYIDFEATEKLVIRGDKMKFKKGDLNTRFAVKLRDGRICFISEQSRTAKITLLICYRLTFGNFTGTTDIGSFNEELLDASGMSRYDIMRIKEYKTTSEAYHSVINNKVENWEWVREEKTEAQIKYEEMRNDLKELQSKMEKFANENNLA